MVEEKDKPNYFMATLGVLVAFGGMFILWQEAYKTGSQAGFNECWYEHYQPTANELGACLFPDGISGRNDEDPTNSWNCSCTQKFKFTEINTNPSVDPPCPNGTTYTELPAFEGQTELRYECGENHGN